MINKTALRVELARANMTQSSLAKITKMSVNSLSNKINGLRSFTVDEANRICDALGITDPATKAKIFFA